MWPTPNAEDHRDRDEQSVHSTQEEAGEAVGVVDGCQSGFWSAEPSVGRVANGVANRVHRLKALGNGQVPLQAAAAYRILESLF